MNFLQYSTPEELKKATGMTVKEAIQKIDDELNELKKGSTEKRD